jgi:branched-chain amino acid transport system permease protein
MALGFDILGFLISWIALFGTYAILSMSLNLEIGFTGMADFGKVAFYGIGAYLAATITAFTFLVVNGIRYPLHSIEAIVALKECASKNPALNVGIFVLCLLVTFFITGAIGYLISYPTLRVGPAFLGITVLSFGELLRIFMRHFELTGGTKGLAGIPHPLAWISNPKLRDGIYSLIILAIMLLTYIVLENIANSPFGRIMRAIRDDEIAALCLGKHVPRVKASVFFLASGFAGIAGVLLAYYLGSVNPDMFVPAVTFNVWAMVIFGGMGNNKGAILGSAIITFVDRISFVINLLFPKAVVSPDYIRWMLIGVLILVTLMFKPQGLMPEVPIKTPAEEVVSKKLEGDKDA